MFAIHSNNSNVLRDVWPTCYFLCLLVCFRLCRTFVSSTVNNNKEQQRAATTIMNKQPDTWAISTFYIVMFCILRQNENGKMICNECGLLLYCDRQPVLCRRCDCSWPSTSFRGSLRRCSLKIAIEETNYRFIFRQCTATSEQSINCIELFALFHFWSDRNSIRIWCHLISQCSTFNAQCDTTWTNVCIKIKLRAWHVGNWWRECVRNKRQGYRANAKN